jgi:mannose-6-phosphate isomerase-like protein (cupin superfamily)
MTTAHKNYTKAEVGKFSNFGTTDAKSNAKTFYKDTLALSGMEISVTAIPPGEKSAFFHSHKQNEELYIVVEGSGQIQLDDELIDLKEGSMIKVQPQARRALRASTSEQLVYLCIQAKENSLEQYTRADGVKHDDINWKN